MGGGQRDRRGVRLVGGAGPGVEELQEAILACLAARPGGLAPRALALAIAERLGLAPEQIADRDLQTALGLLVAGGRVDAAAGRLVAVPRRRRQAG